MVEQNIVSYFPSAINVTYKPLIKDKLWWYYYIVFHFDHINFTESGPPIVQPSTCFKNMLLNFKVHSVVSFTNNHLKINLEQTVVNFFDGRFVQECS